MSVNNSKTQSKHVQPEFKGNTKNIANKFFYYGKEIQSTCISSSKHFLTYIGTKFGESEKQSIEDNTIILTEMTKSKNYASQKESKAEDWDVLLEQKEDRDDYRKYSRTITKHLSQCYSILQEQCNLSLQNKIKNDREFVGMTTCDVDAIPNHSKYLSWFKSQ